MRKDNWRLSVRPGLPLAGKNKPRRQAMASYQRPMPPDESQLRHPLERPVFFAFVVLNVALGCAALWLAVKAPGWLSAYPGLDKYIEEIRAVAVAAVLSLPVLVFARNTRHAGVRGKSIRLSASQMPEIYEALQRHCCRLGMASAPELYLSRHAISDSSQAYSAWHCHYIVLGTDFIQPDLDRVRDVFTFQLARELGRIQVGHTQWWDELLIVYVVRIPYLRNLLLHLRTYSNDRYGAFLAPEGVRGLLALASGRRMLPIVNMPDLLRQAREFRGPWARLSELLEPRPHVLSRVAALYDAGLFRLEDDLRRFSEKQGGPAHV